MENANLDEFDLKDLVGATKMELPGLDKGGIKGSDVKAYVKNAKKLFYQRMVKALLDYTSVLGVETAVTDAQQMAVRVCPEPRCPFPAPSHRLGV